MSPAAAAASFPVIDLSPFVTTGGGCESEVEKEEVINSIRDACSDYGFFVAVNHGIPAEAMDRSFEVAREFFDRSSSEKLKWSPRPDAPLPTGYVKQPDHSPNENEYFSMFQPSSDFNVYPTTPTDFRGVVDGMFREFLKAARLIEGLMNKCLRLPEGLLEKFNDDRQWDLLTAFHYFPATEMETAVKKTGVYPHNDLNLMTLVLQDQVGGLEFLKDGNWIPITPIPHSLVVNVGDLIQVLSNSKFKSSLHKVNSPEGRDRYSYAFAYLIGTDKWVEPLAEVISQTKEEPKFSKFPFKEYLDLRLANLLNPPPNLDDVITIHHYDIPPTVAAAPAN